ncbi:DnaJ domain-containing protein [Schizophyllum amplum]|uniref:DnaJ domain-containing protein n=1 Tax=Schizophyllum amplum TaxID=97359 RepID=A0A550CA37_9AGAR|nr:DnaJ domain-containing protein [Auriculariopsis ampla]
MEELGHDTIQGIELLTYPLVYWTSVAPGRATPQIIAPCSRIRSSPLFSVRLADKVLVDYYAVLSVNRDASPAALKDAYHRALLTHHPDKVHSNGARQITVSLIKEAYDTLSSQSQRERYDNSLSSSRGRSLDHDLRRSYLWRNSTRSARTTRIRRQSGCTLVDVVDLTR